MTWPSTDKTSLNSLENMNRDAMKQHGTPITVGQGSLMSLCGARMLRHASQSWNASLAANLSITDILDMSDELLFAGLDETYLLMNAPIIELPDPLYISPPAVSPSPIVSAPAHPISPSPSLEPTFQKPIQDEADSTSRFRDYQAGQWSIKFEELRCYKKRFGDCLVPHRFTEKPSLGRWVKRQRYQYKRWQAGHASTMTQDRADSLEGIGFVWDSQSEAWNERLEELKLFKARNGHCHVPPGRGKLQTWVKCQKRQYKLFRAGRPSNISLQRIRELETLGLPWETRGLKRQRIA